MFFNEKIKAVAKGLKETDNGDRCIHVYTRCEKTGNLKLEVLILKNAIKW